MRIAAWFDSLLLLCHVWREPPTPPQCGSLGQRPYSRICNYHSNYRRLKARAENVIKLYTKLYKVMEIVARGWAISTID